MTIKTQITYKDLLKFYFKNFFFKPLPIIASIIIVCYFIKEIVIAFQNHFENWKSFIAVLIFLAFISFGLKFYLTVKKGFKSNKILQEQHIYTFMSEKIHIKGETFESEFNWSSIHKIIEVDDWFVVYQSAQLMNMISKRNLTNEEVLEFRNIVKKSGVKAKLKKD